MLQLTTDSPIWAHFKQDKVVVIGYSTGALSGLWLAGARANRFPQKEGTLIYKDYRVRGVVLLSPGHGAYFDPDGLSQINVPTLIIAAENDTVFPLFPNAMFYARYIPNAQYVKLKGIAIHEVFICPDYYQKLNIQKNALRFPY